MKGVIRWCVNNGPAMNILMLGTLLMGAWSFASLRREFFPNYELDSIFISVPYPGASPEEIEEGILEKVEEAVRTVDGIDEMTSTAREGSGTVVLELNPSIRRDEVEGILSEVRSQIDQISSFPELAEEPDIRKSSRRSTAIRLAIVGPDDDSKEANMELRRMAETIRDDLLMLPSVTQSDVVGVPPYEIDIEISEETLRKYNLSLRQVADIVRRENLEIPGGTLRTESQEILLRGSNKRDIGEDIANIPLVTQDNGVVLRVKDLGVVRDEFSDVTFISRIDRRPGLEISVDSTDTEDLLMVASEVKEFAENVDLPAGYEIFPLRDRSQPVIDRLEMLARNGWMGLALVFLMLALFLEMRLAFWVALGIPVSLLGASTYMLYTGHTLNMTTMFAFLIALGIVVDDAIVIGENIYVHRGMGKSRFQAAVDGTYEVMPSVVTSVTTTVIAFLPVMYLQGRLQRLAAALPACVAAMLLISLFEGLTILPCHLGHHDGWFMKTLSYVFMPLRPIGWLIQKANKGFSRLLDGFIERAYLPVLRWSLRNQPIVISLASGLLLLSVGIVRAGIVPYLIFPRVDQGSLVAQVTYPDGTLANSPDEATKRLEDSIWKLNDQLKDKTAEPGGIVLHTIRTVGAGASSGFGGSSGPSGSHVGGVYVQLVPLTERSIFGQEVVGLWRKESGRFPGAEAVAFGGSRGPAGTPIEVRLMAGGEHREEMNAAIQELKDKLAEYPDVSDIATDSRPGKFEYQMKIKPHAEAMGVTLADLANTVRASYYGDEVMRLQRGRHEVQLRVRYPVEERESLAGFDAIRVRLADGAERPLTELADVTLARSEAEIYRIDQMRSTVVSADVDEETGNAFNIVMDLQKNFEPDFRSRYPNVRIRWEGQQEQTTESVNSLTIGFSCAIAGMFLLLTIQFRSYPLAILILSIIPFGFIGAIAGHVLLKLQLTLFSIFGIVALSGVVVNDSIVLIDFVNRRRRQGMTLHQALLDAGRRRFRPVILTSVTTVAGMLPILLETSRQAQVVVPMAVSLSFGLALATFIVLILGPTLYSVMARAGLINLDHDEPLGDFEGFEVPKREDRVLVGAN